MTVLHLRAATKSDPLLSKVYHDTQAKWPQCIPQCLRPYFDCRHKVTVEEGCLLRGIRAIVPKKVCERLLEELHRDHPGMTHISQ